MEAGDALVLTGTYCIAPTPTSQHLPLGMQTALQKRVENVCSKKVREYEITEYYKVLAGTASLYAS